MPKDNSYVASNGQLVWSHGFSESRFNNLVGRIMTQIETLGLPENQEKAFKDIIKQEIWSLWEHAQLVEQKKTQFLSQIH